MKSLTWLLRLLLAGASLLFLGRLGFLFCRTLRQALAFSAFADYDPTVFLVVGALFLPLTLVGLRALVRHFRHPAAGPNSGA